MQLLLPITPHEDYAAELLPLPHQQLALNALNKLQPVNYLTGLRLYGPDGTGKTTLLSVWAKTQNMTFLSKDWLELPKTNQLILDDVDELNAHQQEQLFHWYNAHRQQEALLLISSTQSLRDCKNFLPDLRSRLLTLPAVELDLPDEASMSDLLQNWAKNRQVELNAPVMNYILTHTARDPAIQHKLLKDLDELSLQEQRPITVPLVKTLLAA